jgi:tetratricopeptide (TPR) repeat protein
MTWPKLRSAILSGAIRRGADMKSTKRVLLDADATSTWREVLGKLEMASSVEARVSPSPEKATSEVKPGDNRLEVAERSVVTPLKKKDALPTFSERRVEGLTKLEVERLEEHIDKDKEAAKDAPETTKQTLPIYPSKVTAEEIKKSELQKTPAEQMPTSTSTIRASQESASSWFSVAESHVKKGEYAEAEKEYTRGLALEPENSEAWTRLGSLLMKRGNYKDAEDALSVATKHSDKNADAWYLLGVCLQERNKWDESFYALKTASDIDQNRADIWFKLGLAKLNTGDYQDAARSFLQALRIAPDQTDAMFYLAICMERKGNRQHALSLYTKLLNMTGLSYDVLERMAGSFDRLNRPQEAREARRKASLARRGGFWSSTQ